MTLVNGSATSTATSTLTQGSHSVVAVYSGATGFLTSTSSTLTQNVALANDAFATRTALSGTAASVAGSTTSATKEIGEPNHVNNAGGHSVWYTWTAPSAGTVTIDTAGSGFDTLLAVYTGSSLATLASVPGGANDDAAGAGQTSKVSFAVAPGTTYQIAIDGFSGAAGAYNLHLDLVPPATPRRRRASPRPSVRSRRCRPSRITS